MSKTGPKKLFFDKIFFGRKKKCYFCIFLTFFTIFITISFFLSFFGFFDAGKDYALRVFPAEARLTVYRRHGMINAEKFCMDNPLLRNWEHAEFQCAFFGAALKSVTWFFDENFAPAKCSSKKNTWQRNFFWLFVSFSCSWINFSNHFWSFSIEHKITSIRNFV